MAICAAWKCVWSGTVSTATEFDQMARFVETQMGRFTTVVLKREKTIPDQ